MDRRQAVAYIGVGLCNIGNVFSYFTKSTNLRLTKKLERIVSIGDSEKQFLMRDIKFMDLRPNDLFLLIEPDTHEVLFQRVIKADSFPFVDANGNNSISAVNNSPDLDCISLTMIDGLIVNEAGNFCNHD